MGEPDHLNNSVARGNASWRDSRQPLSGTANRWVGKINSESINEKATPECRPDVACIENGSCAYLRTIVKVALLVTPLCDALMLALIFLFVVVVVILKVAVLAPAGTVMLAGTIAFVGLLLVRVSTKGIDVTLLSFTVPTEPDPPTTVFGFKLTDDSAAGDDAAFTVIVVDLFTPA